MTLDQPPPVDPPRGRRTVAVVVTHNSAGVVKGLLASLPAALGDPAAEVVVVDNASTDETVAVVEETTPGVRIHRTGRNSGYAAAINRVVGEVAPGGALLVLNPDVRLAAGSAARLVAELGGGVGIAVPRLTDEHGRISHSLRRRPTLLRAIGEAVLGGHRAGRVAALGEVVLAEEDYRRPGAVDWATGAVMAVSGECLAEVGGFDESFFLYSEETDFALRAADAGFATRFVPGASAVHIGGASMTSPTLYPLLAVNRLRLYRRRHGAAASAAFRAALVLNEALRAARPPNRAALGMLTRPGACSRALAPFLPDAAGPDFVCFSAQDWWYHNHAHSDFQLMRRVARSRRVLFVNSIGLRMPSSSGAVPPLRRIARKARSVSKLVRRPDGELRGFVVMTPLVVPLYERPLVRRVNAALVRAQVRLAAAAIGIAEPAVMVTIPTAVDVIEGVPRRVLLFNRSDKHSEYVEADGPLIASMEERLLRSADRVLYVSHELMRDDAPLVGDRAVFLDHGVDLEHFRRRPPHEEPPDLAAIPRPRIGFFGGLDDYVVDFALIEHVARSCPDARVVLVGDAGASMDRLVTLPNLHWLGYRPYETIPAYGSGFDVAIMPWLRNDWIRFCNPIKLKEYLALGLPVVSTDYPEGHAYNGYVRWASTPEGFVEQIRRSLEDGGPSTPGERRAAVAGSSWDGRVALLLDVAEGR